jgi:hypothetical protein
MSPLSKSAFLVAVGCSIFSSQPLKAAFLDGKVMQARLLHKTLDSDTEATVDSPDFVVGPNVEVMGFGYRADQPPLPPLVDIDVSDTQIRMTLVMDQPQAVREILEYIDANNTIASLAKTKMNPATNWAGFQSGSVDASEGLINVPVSGLHGLQGQFILLDVIPEPAAGVLLLIGLTALASSQAGVSRRRRS